MSFGSTHSTPVNTAFLDSTPTPTTYDAMTLNAFAFKLDLSSLLQLTSKGDNYAEWRPAWQIAFEWCELWDVVNQKPPRAPPSDATTAAAAAAAAHVEQQAQWKKDNNKALVMLMSAVHPDHIPIITTATSAH
ncbi:hypothetical protein CCMA1212_003243 [Trichoderma ghanense]|uniref:Retrotransposon Copia-like N-terminal domain-containing protein n=1 Tax=Trichoderma ghanense TaxID=65468 RepID=A0ABY2HBZ0_9HYPO